MEQGNKKSKLKIIIPVIIAVVIIAVVAIIAVGGNNNVTLTESVIDNNQEHKEFKIGTLNSLCSKNQVSAKELYGNAPVVVVSKVTKIGSNTIYSGYNMKSYVELKGNWIVETSGLEDIVSQLEIGDIVRITGYIYPSFGFGLKVYQQNGHTTTIEKVSQ